MPAEIFISFPGSAKGSQISFEQKVRWLCENNDYSRALKLCLQTLETFAQEDPADSSFIVSAIINLRRYMPPKHFEEIVKQFNMEPGWFIPPDPYDIEEHKEKVDGFLASLTQVVLEAVEEPENEKERAELRSLIREILPQLSDKTPKYLDIRPYLLLLHAIIDGDNYRERRKQMPWRFRRLFDRLKAGKPYRKKSPKVLKLLKLARKVYGA